MGNMQKNMWDGKVLYGCADDRKPSGTVIRVKSMNYFQVKWPQ